MIQSPIYIDMFNALGANAVPMPFPELYTALEQKAVDGQENPVTTILSSKFNEVQSTWPSRATCTTRRPSSSARSSGTASRPPSKRWINDAMAEATTFQRGVSRVQSDVALDQLRSQACR